MAKLKTLFIVFLVYCSLFLAVPFSAASAVVELPSTFEQAPLEAGIAAGRAGVRRADAPEEYAGKIVTAALSVVGVIFLLLMVYGGYIWMMAKGDEAEAKKAQNIITMAVIGMVVVIAAYAVTKFVVEKLIGAAGG